MTDEQLMEAVKQGDLAQASILFERYHKHLYNFFVKISFDRELGHDLTQNVFLRMIKFKHTYKPEAKFKSWIFQIARNIYADHYRSNKVMTSDFDDVEIIGEKIDAIDVVMEKDENEKLLYIAMYKLEREQREILLLSKFEKMKYEDIAKIYETSVGAIKVKVHRAINKLKENYLQLEKI
jgi:RNA polymerase sigma-70 factor (ECF subfamily)